MSRTRRLAHALLVLPLLAGTVRAQDAMKTAADLARVQVGVGLTPETQRMLGSSADAVVRTFEAALARADMGSFAPGSPSRFMVAIDVQRLSEDVTPTAPPLVAVRARVSARFGDRVSGRAFAEFSREISVTGRTRELAYRTLGNRLRLDDDAWRNAAREANMRIIRYFESSCEQVLGEAQTMVRGEQFEDALLALTSVPREATTCHARAQQEVATAFAAMQQDACGRTFAGARARWAADRSRETARAVADSMGTIPPGSACYADAELLLGEVITILAAVDSAAAERERQEFQLRKSQFEAALNAARQRAEGDASLATPAEKQAFAQRAAIIDTAGRIAVEDAMKKAAANIGTPTLQFSQ